MDQQELLFRYFRHPHRFSTYQVPGNACDLCGQIRPVYAGHFAGTVDVEFVCEPCLASGALATRGVTTNEGDVAALRAQLENAHPGQAREQTESWVHKRTAELEQRTPTLVTWQDFFWPAHCGDYCCFVTEVGKGDLNQLAPDGDGKAFFALHLLDADNADVNSLWRAVREDSPQDNSQPYDVGVYLFRCVDCGHHVIMWDAS